MAKLTSRVGELETTSIDQLPLFFSRARAAQQQWALLSTRKRANHLLQIREAVLNQADSLIELITKENGKPRFEAICNEVLPVIDLLTFYSRYAPKALRDTPIPLMSLLYRKSYLNYWPLGVVVVISPWNFPFSIPFGEIAMALIAGNAVVFKPSEYSPFVGLKIQELCENAGLPPYLLQTILGDGSVGAELIQQKPNKIFFTGSVVTGKKISLAAAENLIPVNLELGGKDPMIILEDADLNFASSAALWGGFFNAGQACASTERILVHESVTEPFLAILKEKINHLNLDDLGLITIEKQKQVYIRQLDQAKLKGATFLTGGSFVENEKKLLPTVIIGENIEDLAVYREETFGPVVAVTTFRSIAEAVKKANDSPYGLCASIITRNHSLGEEIAKQLETGTVHINEVACSHALPETPWGGVKESGLGRTHSLRGLYEFVNTRHIHKPRSRLFVFKSLWWYPYTPYQYSAFREYMNTYRRHWMDKLRAFPHFLWNLVQFIKTEKRL